MNTLTKIALGLGLVMFSGCGVAIPKNDICGTESSWASLQRERIYPEDFKEAVEAHCNLDKCMAAYYNRHCTALIDLLPMTLPPASSTPEQKLRIYFAGIVQPLAKEWSGAWRLSIEQGASRSVLFKQLFIAASHWDDDTDKVLASVKEEIKTLEDGKRKEYLVELYAIAEQYRVIAFDPSGYSFNDYNAKTATLDAQAATILSKLEFTQ